MLRRFLVGRIRYLLFLAAMIMVLPSTGLPGGLRMGLSASTGISLPAYSHYYRTEDITRSKGMQDSLWMSGSFALRPGQRGPAFGGEFFLNFRKVDLGLSGEIFTIRGSRTSDPAYSGVSGRLVGGSITLRTHLLPPEYAAMPYLALGLGCYTFHPSGSLTLQNTAAAGIQVGLGVEAPLGESPFSLFGDMGVMFAETLKVQGGSSKDNFIGVFTFGAGIRWRP